MKIDGELITSRQNRRVVELAKLTDRKAREATKSFRFDGIKLLAEAIKNGVSPDTIFLRATDAERVMERVFAEIGADYSFEGIRIQLLSDPYI